MMSAPALPPSLTLEGIIASARMANWGISILMLQLCSARLLDKWRGRTLPKDGLPMAPIPSGRMIAVGFLLALSQIVGFSLHEYHHFLNWPSFQQARFGSLAALWCVGAARVIVVYSIAYHRLRKMIWCTGWAVTSHLIILGAVWTRIP